MNITNLEKDTPLILVVEDDKFMRIQLRRAMEQVGYQVAEATDGEQGLAAYLRLQPDIVLLDALMPVMDGFTCCTQLRSLPGGDRIPVLMITALEDRESVDRAFEAGAIDYVTKPIHWAVLRQRVRRLLQTSRAVEELRQQTERARLSEERLRLALEASQMGTWDWDILNDNVMHCVTTEAIYGLAPGTFEGTLQSFLKRLHPEDRQWVSQALRSALEEGADYNIEFRIIWPDGSVHWVASKGQVYYDNLGKAVRMTGINMNITERKQAQEELQRQHRRSQLFAEVTLKIRQSLQIENILQTAVTEVQRILASDRVLIFQLCPQDLGKIVTEAVAPGCTSVFDQNVTDAYLVSEYLNRYSQGRVYTIAEVEKAEVPPCLLEFMQKFEIKAKLAVPILLKEKLWGLLIAHQCSSPRHWSSSETELLRHLADQIGIALAQAQLLEQETHQRQELARSNGELEKFAHVASHDLQEPLRKIISFGDRLQAKYGEVLTEQGCDYLERMQKAAERMQTLIHDLLTLSRITTKAQPFVPVNLAQIVQEVLSDLEVRIEQSNGQVEVGGLPILDADPLQMRQLMQNLISNALKFHPKVQSPKVRIESQCLKGEDLVLLGNSAKPTLCQIRVEDNGIGFDEQYLERIFNPFQRLHGRHDYEGTGMGLAICRKIVERHNGSITAQSTLGQGSTFIVTLPLKQHQEDTMPLKNYSTLADSRP
ncbi:ATP-binding protein [Allocoleopsis sp.]|uniref:ATP-binding protein n=1 Tax=Allocoleopsis sp. TaxID=3088169 RepID=UPI002FD5604A